MGNANGPHRGGIDPAKVALRDALRVYVWQHLNKYPGTWFSEVELARVVHEQYVGGPRAPSLGSYHYGRSNAILKVLEWLEGRGEAERQVTRRPARDVRLWRAR